MRGVAVALVGAALIGGLTGCSPGRDAIAAIGYDDDGRLIAAVKVCDGAAVRSSLTSLAKDKQRDVSSWRRGTALGAGVETWQLRGEPTSPWRSTGASLTDLAGKTEYQLGITDEDGGHTSNWLEFRGRDLLRLAPGELLVEHDPDAVTRTLDIIALEELDDVACR